MESKELVEHLNRIMSKIHQDESIFGVHSETCDFLRIHFHPKSSYLQAISSLTPISMYRESSIRFLKSNLQSLIDSVNANVHQGLSPQRQAELDVVSDFLEMANGLLKSPKVHQQQRLF